MNKKETMKIKINKSMEIIKLCVDKKNETMES